MPFTTDPERTLADLARYKSEAEKLARRRAVAQALAMQSMQMSPVQGQFVDPFTPLAKIGQAYFAGQHEKKIDEEASALRDQRRQEVAAALSDYERATTQRPAVPGSVQEDASGNVFRSDELRAFNPSASGRRAAAMRLAGDLGAGEQLAQATLSEAFKTPKLERVDLGATIGLMDEAGNIVRELPKSATPDARLREAGAEGRHAIPSGSSIMSERGAALRHATPSGSAELGARTAMRGQDLVNQRAAEANAIAASVRGDQATTALREEFNKLPEVKNYRNVVPMIQSARHAPDTIAGDIELAYTVGKILDPDSVIREGELKLVGSAATLLERFKGELRALTQGKGRLTPTTRAALVNMMNGRVLQLEQAHDAARSAYEGVARERRLPVEQIFVELRDSGARRSREDILRQYGVE